MLSELQKEEILELISLKQEGAYWDFKKEWYEEGKQPDLLHDIICMSNNLENRDAYIIIGIDEENDYCVNDMTNAENRKSTQMLVDFVRNKKFAGGIRPRVMVETMQLETGTIDIIVIKNGYSTPYVLELLLIKRLFNKYKKWSQYMGLHLIQASQISFYIE